jgi:hypothetical protein
MSDTYSIEVTITPLCSSCGKELEVGITQSRPTGHPFDRDNPYERTHRRVFITACRDCYTFTGGKVAETVSA